ncbi:hypothetical protein TSAR_002197 [Trichomalopsis sarcophagae]|uniref:Crossover junction endonuclease MUS81 n=1 Tax=Trichomalopsis sarcophagae TaxID=543379 RepID=A0A232FF66_9HYME|nr:hypothetical protein TSAR_002197 [Trichomalopsis sarcophagae]
MKRRHTPCFKPLFEKWLEEWKDYAIQTGNPIHYSYGKALASLRQCPLRFESGKTCLLVRNFGPKLCDMLDKKLAAYRAENNLPPISEEPIVPAHVEAGGKVRKIDNHDARKNKKIKKVVNSPISRPYIPKIGSAAYAILVTLYKKSLEPNYPGYMFKKDIITEAQSNSDCEMKSNALQHYSGWSSMTTLIEKNFVVKKNCPAKYSLTDAGLALAISLYEGKSSYQTDEEEGVIINDRISTPSTSISNESKSTKSESNGSKSNGSKNSRSKSSGSKLSEENLNNQDIANLLDDYDDDVFERDTKETENTKLDFCEKMKSKTLDKASAKSASDSDDDYDKFCKENPEPIITVKRTEQHFIFREVTESHGPLNEINNKMDSQCFVDEGQKKIETAIKRNEKVVEKSHPKKNSVDDTPSEDLFLLANNFDIILLVDTQETSGNKTKPKDDATISELSKSGILYEVRSLKVGDFLWIARCRLTDRELVLPYIVERKRIDDLSGSIKDGRYHEQKFRLRQSGIENITYLVENYGGTVSGSIPLTSLFQAAVNSFIHEDFTIKFTKDHRDSMRYLSRMTKSLTSKFEGKELWCCSKKDLQPGRLMAFHEFNKAAVKTKKRTVKQMLVHQLLQLKGVSVEKAMAIADLYPTPKILAQAFHQADDKLLANIESGSFKRKLGLTISKTFHQLYTRYNLS